MAADSWLTWRDPRKLRQAWAVLGVALALGFLFQAPSHALFAWLSPSGDSPVDSFHRRGVVVGLGARAVAWGFNTSVIGLAVGIVTGNLRAALPLTMGGVLGGIIAGLLFDPLQFLAYDRLGHSAWLSRLCGFILTGGMAGFVSGTTADCMRIGVIRVRSGPLAGYQATVDSRPCFIGSSPRCQVNLGGNASAEPPHAVILKSGFRFCLESLGGEELLLNDHAVLRARLNHGDRIRVGTTEMMFVCRGLKSH